MSLLRAGQGDSRLPAREGESWADYMERLSGAMKNGTLGAAPRVPGQPWEDVREIPDTYRLPYRDDDPDVRDFRSVGAPLPQRDPGEDDE